MSVLDTDVLGTVDGYEVTWRESGYNSGETYPLRYSAFYRPNGEMRTGTLYLAPDESFGVATFASVRMENKFLAMFSEDGLKFTRELRERPSNAHVSNTGRVAFAHGPHRDQVFTVLDSEGEPIFRRRIGSCRGNSISPNGKYVATWKLSESVLIFDIDAGELAGQWPTSDLSRGTNVNLVAVRDMDTSQWKVIDNSDDSVICRIDASGTEL